jgi:hypothetical protein
VTDRHVNVVGSFAAHFPTPLFDSSLAEHFEFDQRYMPKPGE